MAYVALYRKYRSSSFDELMGQDAVTTTLRNSIASGRFGHAYLFHGARGCGKTSTARLLARALNCEEGPTPNPCGVCKTCIAVRNGNCLDVIEMDAASETGIDDVREKVIENVQYAPAEARFKVYIIDEVHDLSAKAFDALLKTLEEPPAHVVFVLATTEMHKVPITIRSRCMCFQFRRGSLLDLSSAVQRVVTAEGFTADPDAVQAIARSAEGSWRDALSILEQVLAYSDGHVSAETVRRAIGTVGDAELEEAAIIFSTGSMGDALELAARYVESGVDIRQLIGALQGFLRDMLLLSAGANVTAEKELGVERVTRLKTHADKFNPVTLLQMGAELAAAEKDVRLSNYHRWILERTLARLQAIAQDKHAALSPSRPVSTPPVTQSVSRPQANQSNFTRPESRTDVKDEYAQVFPPESLDSTEENTLQGISHTVSDGTQPGESDDNSRFATAVTLEVIQRAWPNIVKLFVAASPRGGPFLKKAQVTGLEGSTILLAFEQKFDLEQIQGKGKPLLEKKLNEALHTSNYRIQCMQQTTLEPKETAVVEVPAPLFTPQPERAESSIGDEAEIDSMPAESGNIELISESNVDRTETEPTLVEPEETSILQETLDIFGGEVVKSDPIH